MSGKISINRYGRLFLTAALASVLLAACGGSGGEDTTDTTIIQSTKNSNNSHNSGMDCLNSSCHGQAATSTRPQFTLAGTVYMGTTSTNIYPNVEIHLLKNGVEWKTIPVNNLGNFYTTATIDWGTNPNLTARVVTQSGNSAAMTSLPVPSNGDCNGCHDSSFRIHG